MGRHSGPPPPHPAWLVLAVVVAVTVVGYGWVTHRPAPSLSVTQPVTIHNDPSIGAPAVTVTVPPPRVTVTVPPPKVPPARTTVIHKYQEVVKTVPAPRRCPLPNFPGAAYLGDRGPVARTWQAILIAAGVIHDWPVNRDSYFGPAMHAKVIELQRAWGWTPIPGYAGPRTYRKLKEQVC